MEIFNLSWKNVLDCKKTYGHISNMQKTAQLVQYPYFIWNGRVYVTSSGNVTNLLETDVK